MSKVENSENLMEKIDYAIKAVIEHSQPFSILTGSLKIETLEMLYAMRIEAGKHISAKEEPAKDE